MHYKKLVKRHKTQEKQKMEKKWWHHLTAYQIYTRSFCDSNGDGIGDFQGIISKLDYLQELGIGAIWISPFNDSPNYDNGYDISDYYAILKDFGTMADLEEMIQECEKRDIIVMMDLVLNHCSHEHPWFLGACKDRNGKYYDYYIWEEGTEDQPPEGSAAFFGGNVWEWVPQVKEYYYHTFSIQQPDLNWKNENMRQELYAMIRFWMDKGIRGFRLDAIDNIVKDGHGGNDQQSPQIHTYLQEMTKNTFGLRNDVLTVGETGGTTLEMAKEYSNPERKELDMVFQFKLMDIDGVRSGNWEPKAYTLPQLKTIMASWQTGLDEIGWNSLFWGNHDYPRAISRFGNDTPEYREQSGKMLATLLYGMKGTPYLYQGDEIGMTNVVNTKISQYQDIESANFAKEKQELGWSEEKIMSYLLRNSRDNARTPMQWNHQEHAGFTTGTPWLSVNGNYKEINVENSRKNPDSLFYYYKTLIALRKNNDVLIYGKFQLLDKEHPEIFAYERTLDGKKIVVICNFTDYETQMEATEDLTDGKILIHNQGQNRLGKEKWILGAYEAWMIEIG